MSPVLSEAAPSEAGSLAPRKARSASGAINARGEASATLPTRLGSPAIGATRPTNAPRGSKPGPPLAPLSTAAVTNGRASPPVNEAELAARRDPSNPRTTRSSAGEPSRGAPPFDAKSPASITRPVAVSARSIRTGLPATVGCGQSSALSAVKAFPGATTSAVAAGCGTAGGGAALDAGGVAGVVAALTPGAAADSGNGSNELATAIATWSRMAVCDAG